MQVFDKLLGQKLFQNSLGTCLIFTSGSCFMLQVHNSSDIVLLQGSNSAVSACQPPGLLQTAVIDRIFINYIGNLLTSLRRFWRTIIKLVYLFNCVKCGKVRAPLHSIKYSQFQFVSYTVDDAYWVTNFILQLLTHSTLGPNHNIGPIKIAAY